jgi:hypothetical protein
MLLLQADQGKKVTVIHSSKLVYQLIRAYVEDTDDDIPMPEGPPPGMSKDEEEVDTDEDIPMPDGPPPGSTSKSHPFDAWRVLMTRLDSIHITPHPATPATTSWFPSRYRRYTSSASRFPQRTLPPTTSRFPRTTARTTRLPWRRAALKRIHSCTSGAI